MEVMSVPLNVPDEVVQRLTVEAEHSGTSIEDGALAVGPSRNELDERPTRRIMNSGKVCAFEPSRRRGTVAPGAEAGA
jgi:hypothetical protein